jgi:hypothetical protein
MLIAVLEFRIFALLLVISVTGAELNADVGLRQSSLDDVTFDHHLLWSKRTTSRLQCATVCMSDPGCISYTVNAAGPTAGKLI